MPLFVCAVGIPPSGVVERLHQHGIKVMNMVGRPRHVEKALAVGVDIICAQGSEGGGHTGEIATLPLIPQIVDAVRGRLNAFGTPVPVVAAGGIFDGRGIAACLRMGASGVWLGTRFLVANESVVAKGYREDVVAAKSEDTTRIEIFSGRPMRVLKTAYTDKWETPEKVAEMQKLLAKGTIPLYEDVKNKEATMADHGRPMSQAIGGISKIQPASEIMADLMAELLAAMETDHIAIKAVAEVQANATAATAARL